MLKENTKLSSTEQAAFNDIFVSDYQQGISDCKRGLASMSGASEEYLDGYCFQYQVEASQSAREFN